MESQYKSQLKSIVLNLRHILEGRFDDAGIWRPGDLEERLASLGVRLDREALPLEHLSHLSEEDRCARQIVDAFIQSHLQSGRSREEAIQEFLKESAYTWANRLLALRCMEARGLIDEVVLQKENYGGRSLKHHRMARQNPELCAGDDDGLYVFFLAEFTERAEELPLLFHPLDPVIALKPGVAALKRSIQQLSAPDEIFTAPDALGWAYQYWNTEEKDRIFEKVRTVKGAKIEKGDIIPVTQLYTEPYMVKFLVQNSLGALWKAMHPESRLCESWKYYVRDTDRVPIAKIPIKRLSFLDPCVGSGHFLLEAFDIIYAMYEEEGELSDPADICEAILNHNLYGIDIDERAIQIAALALFMKAKEKSRDFKPMRINLVATNIHPAGETDHLTAFLTKHPEDKPFRDTLRLIFNSLEHADELGSLLQIEEPVEKEVRYLKSLDDEDKTGPAKQTALFQEMEKPEQQPLPLGVQSYEEWKEDLLTRLNAHFREEFASADFSTRFFGDTAEKGLTLFDFLSRRYDVVATNPPYFGAKKMPARLVQEMRLLSGDFYSDTYVAFIKRGMQLAKENGKIAILCRDNWTFHKNYQNARIQFLEGHKIELWAALGSGAFSEPLHSGVSIAMFILTQKNSLAGIYLNVSDSRTPEEKNFKLIKGPQYKKFDNSVFSKLPLTIFAPDAPRWALELIENGIPLINVCPGTDGTVVISRYTRFFWEVRLDHRWKVFSKGGGFKRWYGLNYWVIDWRNYGDVIEAYALSRYPKEKLRLVIKDKEFITSHGITYTSFANRSLAVRLFEKGSVPSNRGPCFCSNEAKNIHSILSFLNSNHSNRLVRLISPSIEFGFKYVAQIPISPHFLANDTLMICAIFSIELQKILTELNIIEFTFNDSVSQSNYLYLLIASFEIAVISLINREISAILKLDQEEHEVLFIETGTPAGWFPLIQGYDFLPSLPEGLPDIPKEVLDFLNSHEHSTLEPETLTSLRERLRTLYEVGPGVREEVDDTDGDATDDDQEENEQVAVGARIPIPAETFLEELSQKIKIHPISVYWLLVEGIKQEGWRCLPEEQRLKKDCITVLILRLLGHRWPKQIESGESIPEWADKDGIIPLMEGSGEANLYRRLRGRLAADYGDEQASFEENAFEKVMGKPLQEWVQKDFLRNHISQFKKRPIAWHLSSAQRTSRARQEAAFECLVYYHRTDGDLLPKIRSHYVAPLLKRLELELLGLENVAGGGLVGEQASRKDLLRYQSQELKAFDGTLSDVIVTGFGPENLRPQLRQYGINDAMLCLKARWLKKLSVVIQAGPLPNWQQEANQAGFHAEFSTWIADAMTHLDHHCTAVGPNPPDEKTLEVDPTAPELAKMICAEAESMLTCALICACKVWWKSFEIAILKPISEKVRDAKKELQSHKELSENKQIDTKKLAEIKQNVAVLKSDIKAWQKELALKSGQGNSVREAIESWHCPDAMTWESWLAGQEMYDKLSSLNAKRPPPQTVQDFVRQESLYHPNINDGVRVNIAPLQKTGLLTVDVLAGKDVVNAIADRASWRDDERRWCREGKLPKPGWWE